METGHEEYENEEGRKNAVGQIRDYLKSVGVRMSIELIRLVAYEGHPRAFGLGHEEADALEKLKVYWDIISGSLALDWDRYSARRRGWSSQEAVPPRRGARQRPLEGGRIVEEGVLVCGHHRILASFISVMTFRGLITMDRLLTSATGRRGALDDEE